MVVYNKSFSRQISIRHAEIPNIFQDKISIRHAVFQFVFKEEFQYDML